MGRFVIHADDYETVYVSVLGSDTIVIDTKPQLPMEEWTSPRLCNAYKKAYKSGNKRLMGRVRTILQHKYGQDIFVKNGKVNLYTYNGCEKKGVN